MDINYLRKEKLILFECISGSRAQGLDTKDSDTDIKGVFYLPKEHFYGFEYIPQITNETNDIVFYELKRFLELLYKNNPNILEMLNVSKDDILIKHQVMDHIEAELFLSKLCKDTFANYAMTQLKKARGLNKKILNPVSEEKKSIMDFCYMVQGDRSVPVKKWLEDKGYVQEKCGLVNIPHMTNVYALFYDDSESLSYQGILRKEESDLVALSSIPKGETPIGTMSCNKDGYSAYCKDYKEYWEWVKKRNDVRYRNTIDHGKNYDAKNMMHTFRLLSMAEEILRDGKVNVKRSDRDELLRIKSGEYEYDYLVAEAEKKMKSIEAIYESSSLPERPDKGAVEKLLVRIRCRLYKE